jgi:hypothetical protein
VGRVRNDGKRMDTSALFSYSPKAPMCQPLAKHNMINISSYVVDLKTKLILRTAKFAKLKRSTPGLAVLADCAKFPHHLSTHCVVLSLYFHGGASGRGLWGFQNTLCSMRRATSACEQGISHRLSEPNFCEGTRKAGSEREIINRHTACSIPRHGDNSHLA